MKLSEEEIRKFYRIWLNLINYTNNKYNLVPNYANQLRPGNIDPNVIAPIKDRLWLDNTILDEIISTKPNQFSESDLLILDSWKNRVAEKFILLKHLKNYSIFLGNNQVYGVTGLTSPIEELLPSFALPLIVDAVLIPFEGRIIHDSILRTSSVHFGGGIKKQFQQDYRELKAQSGIITSLV